MSREMVKVHRQRLALKGRSRRGLEERFALRFPRIAAMFAAAVWRLPRGSRLRMAIIRRTVVLGWEAMNRADFEVGLALYHPDVESIQDDRARSLGFANVRGWDERMAMLHALYGQFREFRLEPDELLYVRDDQLLVLGRMSGEGAQSGAPFDTEWANLWTISSSGQVIRDRAFTSHEEAFQAAGLAQDAR